MATTEKIAEPAIETQTAAIPRDEPAATVAPTPARNRGRPIAIVAGAVVAAALLFGGGVLVGANIPQGPPAGFAPGGFPGGPGGLRDGPHAGPQGDHQPPVARDDDAERGADGDSAGDASNGN